jgi:hypothetical protein
LDHVIVLGDAHFRQILILPDLRQLRQNDLHRTRRLVGMVGDPANFKCLLAGLHYTAGYSFSASWPGFVRSTSDFPIEFLRRRPNRFALNISTYLLSGRQWWEREETTMEIVRGARSA